MADVPYPHIEAPGNVAIGGALAFMKGDPIPQPTAERYGLPGEVLPGLDARDDGRFADVAIVTTDEGSRTYEAEDGDATPAQPPRGPATPTGEGA